MIDRLRVTMYSDSYEDHVTAALRELGRRCDLTVHHPAFWRDVDRLSRTDTSSVRSCPLADVRIRDPRRPLSVARVLRNVRSMRPDVFHVQQAGDPWFGLGMQVAPPKVPIVVTVHDVVPHPGDRAQVPGNAARQRAWAHRIDRFIVHSAAQSEDLALVWGIDRARIDVIEMAELGGLVQRRAGRTVNVAREPATVLFYGRRYAYKGLDALIEAMRILAGRRNDLRLVVAGAGDPLDPVLAGLPRNVVVERHDGWVDDTTTLELFARSSLVCLPYIEASQSGVAALATGLSTPIVATDVGGLPELVRDGLDGVIVPPGDASALAMAIGRLLDDPSRLGSISAQLATRAANELSQAIHAERTIDVYQRALRR